MIPGASAEVVGNRHLIAAVGKVQRCWPATVAITAKNENPHRLSLCLRVVRRESGSKITNTVLVKLNPILALEPQNLVTHTVQAHAAFGSEPQVAFQLRVSVLREDRKS